VSDDTTPVQHVHTYCLQGFEEQVLTGLNGACGRYPIAHIFFEVKHRTQQQTSALVSRCVADSATAAGLPAIPATERRGIYYVELYEDAKMLQYISSPKDAQVRVGYFDDGGSPLDLGAEDGWVSIYDIDVAAFKGA